MSHSLAEALRHLADAARRRCNGVGAMWRKSGYERIAARPLFMTHIEAVANATEPVAGYAKF
jgi:hypothetical protein